MLALIIGERNVGIFHKAQYIVSVIAKPLQFVRDLLRFIRPRFGGPSVAFGAGHSKAGSLSDLGDRNEKVGGRAQFFAL